VRCRSCTKAQVRRHYDQNRASYLAKARLRNNAVIEEKRRRILQYLKEHPCVDCGESDIVCLEFDHVCGVKVGNIGRMLGDYT